MPVEILKDDGKGEEDVLWCTEVERLVQLPIHFPCLLPHQLWFIYGFLFIYYLFAYLLNYQFFSLYLLTSLHTLPGQSVLPVSCPKSL